MIYHDVSQSLHILRLKRKINSGTPSTEVAQNNKKPARNAQVSVSVPAGDNNLLW